MLHTIFSASFELNLSGFPALLFMFIVLAIPVAVIAAVVSHIARKAHAVTKTFDATIITEYEAPDNLRPAEIGYLYDSRLGTEEFIATLLDLEQRGHIQLAAGSMGNISVQVVKPPAPNQLLPYEEFVITTAQHSGSLLALSLQARNGFKHLLASSLAGKGYIRSTPELLRYYGKRAFIAYACTMAVISALVLAGTTPGDAFSIIAILIVVGVFCFPFFFGVSLVGLFVYNRIVGQPGIWTAAYKTIYPQIAGYREFIRQVELDNLQFESEDLKQRTKNTTLPYAVALGLDTKWKERF